MQTCSFSNSVLGRDKIEKHSQVNFEEAGETQMPSFTYITSRKRQRQTLEQKEKRLFGLIEKSNTNTKRSGNSIVKFVDQVETNQKLKEIYESIKKQQQGIDKKHGSLQKSPVEEEHSPVYRPSYRLFFEELDKKKLAEINSEAMQKMSREQQLLMQYFPNISKFGLTSALVKEEATAIGQYNGKVVKKCYVTDLLQFAQPTYLAIYLEEAASCSEMPILSELTIDETVEVILIG